MNQEEKTRKTREKIMSAAMHEFASNGYAGASINTICQSGGISKGNLYHQFPSKEELYIACVREAFRSLTDFLKMNLPNQEITPELYFQVRSDYFRDHPLEGGVFCNAVLFLGLVGIYIIHFTSAPKSRANAEATEPLVKDGGLTIAYVDTDTLLANYQYAKDLEKELLAFKNQQEAYGKQQVEKFQNDYQNYLKNGSSMTLSQQQAKEAELKQRAEKMASLEQELAAKVMERQINENTKLLNAIFAFVREYNKDNQKFDIILRKTFENSPTLYMNPGMDITQEILDGLNEEYKNLKKSDD